MNAAIVDTDVVSVTFKGSSTAPLYRGLLEGQLLAISFMTLAELERWTLERNWGPARKADLAFHLQRYVVIPATRELCLRWAAVTFGARRKGRPIQTADAWIAATALHYRVPLVTNNAADFEAIDGLHVVTAAGR